MAQFSPAFDFLMVSEDPEKYCEEVPDAPVGARAISGVNSAAWPLDFDKIAALPQSERLPAVQAFYETNFCWVGLNRRTLRTVCWTRLSTLARTSALFCCRMPSTAAAKRLPSRPMGSLGLLPSTLPTRSTLTVWLRRIGYRELRAIIKSSHATRRTLSI